MLIEDSCEETFPAASGLGLSLNVKLRSTNRSQKIHSSGFSVFNLKRLKLGMAKFAPFVVVSGTFDYYSKQKISTDAVELVIVSVNIISFSPLSLFHMESTLVNFIRQKVMYDNIESGRIALASQFMYCLDEVRRIPNDLTRTKSEWQRTSLDEWDYNCNHSDCHKNIDFQPLQLTCPFLEYVLNQTEFIFYADRNIIEFYNEELCLVQYTVHHFIACGGILRICVDDLSDIAEEMAVRGKQTKCNTSRLQAHPLRIVSLTSRILSLEGFSLTFFTFIVIPELRTLYGKNTMAMVFHLFLAHLLSLAADISLEDGVLCRVFGAIMHYFWMAAFSWMSTLFYFIHIVFNNIQVPMTYDTGGRKRFIRYTVVCLLIPLCVVVMCLAFHLVKSNGAISGYGGKDCLLVDLRAFGFFFAVPLGAVLVFNGFLIAKTIIYINSTSNIRRSSSANSIHRRLRDHIMLSALLGLTWTIYLMNEIFDCTVLLYVFNFLIGSQGALLFVRHCLNGKTMVLLKIN